MDRVSAGIDEDLNLDMPGLLHVFLHKDPIGSECGKGFFCAGTEGGLHFALLPHQPDPPSAASVRSLQQNGVSDSLRGNQTILKARHGPAAGRYDGDTGSHSSLFGADLVAEHVKNIRSGSDERNVCFRAQLGKCAVFREKTTAGIDTINVRDACCAEDPVWIHVGCNILTS